MLSRLHNEKRGSYRQPSTACLEVHSSAHTKARGGFDFVVRNTHLHLHDAHTSPFCILPPYLFMYAVRDRIILSQTLLRPPTTPPTTPSSPTTTNPAVPNLPTRQRTVLFSLSPFADLLSHACPPIHGSPHGISRSMGIHKRSSDPVCCIYAVLTLQMPSVEKV